MSGVVITFGLVVEGNTVCHGRFVTFLLQKGLVHLEMFNCASM